MHRDTHITNLRGLNLTTPGESDGFCVNPQRVAVPLAISGGQMAIFEVRQSLEIKLKTVYGIMICKNCGWSSCASLLSLVFQLLMNNLTTVYRICVSD